jgi:multidrug efflux system membrane fusion protein
MRVFAESKKKLHVVAEPGMRPVRAHFIAPTAVFAGIAVVFLGLLAGCSEKKQPAPRPMSVAVTVAKAELKDVPLEINAIGTVESPTSVQVKSMISAEITGVNFKEGQEVKKGDLLFTLDRRPGEADLRRAEATLAKDIATAAQMRSDARRYQALFKEGVVAQQQADQMQAAAEAAEALVEADRAAVANAKVQLTYTNIYSPISGRTGNLSIQLGNVIKANDTPFLVTINQINPIYVTFAIPEQLLGQVKKYMAHYPLTVRVAIPNDPQPAVGKLTFVDNTVDRQTGTIKLKGTFPNADHRLWPGQFVNAKLILTTEPNAVVVPTAAIQNGQQGQFLFVIRPDLTAESRPVKISRTLGDRAVVQDGVHAGETVVTDGQLRLTSGAKVEIKNNSSGQNAEAKSQGATS